MQLSWKLVAVVLTVVVGVSCSPPPDATEGSSPATPDGPTVPTTVGSSTTTSTTEADGWIEPFSFGEPIYLDALDVVGSLSSPEGWEVWIDDGGTVLFSDGASVVCEAGEACPTGWVSIEAYAAADLSRLALFLAEGDAAVVAGLKDVIWDYYAWIGAQEWGSYEFEPIEPEPAPVGSLPGVHFGYSGKRGGESIQHTDAYAAFDGTYLYLIWVRLPEVVPNPGDSDFVETFAPSLETIVANLRLPLEPPVHTPVLATDWSLESGDLLVASWEGIVISPGASGAVSQVVSTEPTSQAHGDGMGGFVFQRAFPRSGPGAAHPLEMAIWWVPEPGAAPIVLHEPAPGAPASLFGVAEIDESPHALYMVAEPREDPYFDDYVLVAHDLTSGDPVSVGVVGGGEVWPDCVSWAVDRFVVSTTAEENSFFSFMSMGGQQLELGGLIPAELDPGRDAGTWYASTCAAIREPDGRAAVVLRTFEGPNWLLIVDPETGTEIETFEIDAETLAEGAEMEMWPGDIGHWQTRVQFVGDRVLITDLGYGLSPPIIADLTTGEVTIIPVEGMGSLVP